MSDGKSGGMSESEQYIYPETGVDLTTEPPPLAVQQLADGRPRCGYFEPVAQVPEGGHLRQCVLERDHLGEHKQASDVEVLRRIQWAWTRLHPTRSA